MERIRHRSAFGQHLATVSTIRRATSGMHTKPCRLLFEGIGEPQGMIRPWNSCHDGALLGTVHPHGHIFDEGHGHPKVKGTQIPGGWRAIVDGRLFTATETSARLPLARAREMISHPSLSLMDSMTMHAARRRPTPQGLRPCKDDDDQNQGQRDEQILPRENPGAVRERR